MISLVTLTGDRPECFARCERMMARQTYRQGWQWIVVDDGMRATNVTGGQRLIRRGPSANPAESFKNNLRAGLNEVTGDFVFIIEDDDWYALHHIERLLVPLMDFDVVGEARAKYYNVAHRKYRQLENRHHASLCQTAFRRSMIPLILRELETAFVDIRLWGKATSKFLFPESESCVGLKGQKGRTGIGIGHFPRGEQWHSDPDGTVLREWIKDDAEEVLRETPHVHAA